MNSNGNSNSNTNASSQPLAQAMAIRPIAPVRSQDAATKSQQKQQQTEDAKPKSCKPWTQFFTRSSPKPSEQPKSIWGQYMKTKSQVPSLAAWFS